MLRDSYADLILFFLITLLAEVLGTLGGFGSSLFFVSMAQFFYDFRTVLMLTGLLHIFSNIAKVILFRKFIQWKLVLWLGISSAVLAIAGAFLSNQVDLSYARIVLGIFLVSFSLLFYFYPAIHLQPNVRNSVWGGSVAGFLAGFIGTGGAIRGLVLASFNLDKNFFVGTSAAIDFGVDLSRTIIYAESNYFNPSLWIYVPLLMGASFAGSYIGKKALGKISETSFRKVVLGLVFIMGITLITGYIH
jgi:uncharacterized protein